MVTTVTLSCLLALAFGAGYDPLVLFDDLKYPTILPQPQPPPVSFNSSSFREVTFISFNRESFNGNFMSLGFDEKLRNPQNISNTMPLRFRRLNSVDKIN